MRCVNITDISSLASYFYGIAALPGRRERLLCSPLIWHYVGIGAFYKESRFLKTRILLSIGFSYLRYYCTCSRRAKENRQVCLAVDFNEIVCSINRITIIA